MESSQDNSKAELVAKRNLQLPPIIDSLNNEQSIAVKLEKMQICTEYLLTFNLEEVDEKLLQFVVPEMKKSILKLFEENILLFDTTEDDFVIEIIKQNLKMTSKLIQIEKAILQFILIKSDVNLKQVHSVPVDSAEIIRLAFQHCKNSPESYQNVLSVELLEVFHLTKEVHATFLKIMENVLVIEEFDKNILLEVLDTLCCINEVLCEMNVRSLMINWKSYTGIVQKYSDLLKDQLNLRIAFKCLNDNLVRNFKVLEKAEVMDSNYLSQVVKVTSFLLKVALKLIDTFWDVLHRTVGELAQFCCIVYQYVPERLGQLGYSEEIFNLFVNNKLDLDELMQPLLGRLIGCNLGRQVVYSFQHGSNEHHGGLLNFLNSILKIVLSTSKTDCDDLKVDELVEEIFRHVNSAYADLFCNYVLDELVLTITAAIITSSNYSKAEYILLKNLFGDSPWNSILATEIWCLLLSNSPPQLCLETVEGLIDISEKLNFGNYTKRVEEVYLKCLLRRLLKTLPPEFKRKIFETYPFNTNKYVWRLIGIDQLGRKDCNVFISDCLKEEDRLLQVENLELLSTVNFDEVDEASAKRLAERVSSFWETVDLCPRNNAFRYFTNGLCKLTGQICLHLTNKQLLNILTQLKSLCTDVPSRSAVCDCLHRFAPIICSNIGRDVITLTSDIVSTLLKSDNVVRRNVVEFIKALMAGGKQDVVVNVMRSCNEEIQGEIMGHGNYEMVENFRFRHECVRWKASSVKRFKPDVPDAQKKETRPKPVPAKVDLPLPLQQQQQDDTVSDVIRNIRGEVKCLMNALKNEKMTTKNASDLRAIANQLLSLM